MRRFTIESEDPMGTNLGIEIEDDPNGPWVEYEEIEKILAEKDRQLEEAKALLNKLENHIDECTQWLRGLTVEQERLLSASYNLLSNIRAYLSEEKEADCFCEVVARDYFDTSTGQDTKLFVMNCGPDIVRPEFPPWKFCPYCGKPILLIEDGNGEDGDRYPDCIDGHYPIPANEDGDVDWTRCPTCNGIGKKPEAGAPKDGEA